MPTRPLSRPSPPSVPANLPLRTSTSPVNSLATTSSASGVNTSGTPSLLPPLPVRASGALSPASLQTYFFPAHAHKEAEAALNKPEIKAILNGSGLTIVDVGAHPLTNVRRLLEEGFRRRKGQCVLSLVEEKALSDLEKIGVINPDASQAETKPLVSGPGPLGEICEKGGVLLFNVANIDSASIEGFNDLSERKDGVDTPKVRVILLCTKADIDHCNLSPAVVSRGKGKSYISLRHVDLPDLPDSKRRCKDDPDMKNAYPPIDMKNTDEWRTKLLGGAIPKGQKWENDPGEIARCPKDRPILLENAPDDELLEDEIIILQNRGRKIYFAAPPNDDELFKRAADKAQATDIQALLSHSPDCAHVVNWTTVDNLIDADVVLTKGKLDVQPALLDQDATAGKTSALYVTQSLDDSTWQRLMSHPHPFRIAAAPDVTVPNIYQSFVHSCQPLSVPDNQALFSVPVGFMKSYDPKLINQKFLKNVKRIYVDSNTTIEDLICKLEPDPSKPRHWKGTTQPLLKALQNAEPVILIGPEHSPDALQSLDPLLRFPHIMKDLNGKIWHFGPGGGLTGKMLVLTGSDELIKSFSNEILHADPLKNNLQVWETAVLKGLSHAFQHIPPHALKAHLDNVLSLQSILIKQNLTPDTDPPFNYSQLETLFRHSIDLPEFNKSMPLNMVADKKRAQILRNVFKDTLISSPPRTRVRSGSEEPEPLYAYLKMCLRVLSPSQMERMPPQSVNIERLTKQLQNIYHEKAILEDPWEYLGGCFSRDVVCALVGDPSVDPGNRQAVVDRLADKQGCETDIGKAVLALVIDTAIRHNIPMQPWLKKNADALRIGELAARVGPTLQIYTRPVPEERITRERQNRDRAKVGLLLSKSNKACLKGEPGSGKTHLGEALKTGEYYVPLVADEGEEALNQTFDGFMQSKGLATLFIDEVTLFNNPHVLDRLSALALAGSPDKRIIVTTNDAHFEGRILPDFVRDAMPTQRCCTLPNISLFHIFVKPQFAKLDPPVDPKVEFEIAKEAILMYRNIQNTFPTLQQSPRSLTEFTMQVVCVMDITSLRSFEEIKPYLNYIARQAYTNALPDGVDRQAAEMWLNIKYGSIKQESIDKIASVDDCFRDNRLADTPETRKQAQSLCWWVRMLDQRITLQPTSGAMGLKAKLIQGPAGIGKTRIYGVVFDTMGRKFIRMNAKQWNFDEFKTNWNEAAKEGAILCCDEMNVWPTKDIESVMNTPLTQPTSGEGLLATINPLAYAGRQALSPASLDRMLQDHWKAPDHNALLTITEHLAKKIVPLMPARRSLHLSPQATARQTGLRQQIDQEEIEELADMTWKLQQKLEKANDPYAGALGVRQIENILNALVKAPASRTVRQLFEEECGLFVARANDIREDDVAETTDIADRLQLYAKIMRLTHPDMRPYPRWMTLPNIEPGSARDKECAVVYDPVQHILYANPNRAPIEVARYLPNRTLYSPDGSTTNILDKALLDSARAKSKKYTSSMAPPDAVSSGAGTKPPVGVIGYVTGTQDSRLYLPTSRSAQGKPLQYDLTGYVVDNTTPPSVPQQSERFGQEIVVKNGEERIYVGASANMMPTGGDGEADESDYMRPTKVKIDGKLAAKLDIDELGNYYVLAGSQGEHANVTTYTVTCGFVGGQIEPPLKTDTIKLGIIDPEWPDDVKKLIGELRPLVNSLPPKEIARRVRGFLSAPRFLYDDTVKFDAPPTSAKRNTEFLHGKKGVCAEFATATEYIQNAVGVLTVRVGGRVTNRGDIPKATHAWNELLLPGGKRLAVDHTPPSFLPQTGLDQTLEDNEENRQFRGNSPTRSDKSILSDEQDENVEGPTLNEVMEQLVYKYDEIQLPLKDLGLEYRRLGSANQDRIYTSEPTSKLDPMRYALGTNPKMFIKKGLPQKETAIKSLVLTRPPDHLIKPLLLPLCALQDQGVELLHENGIMKSNRVNIVLLFAQWTDDSNKSPWSTKKERSSAGNVQTRKRADGRFYESLVQRYYQGVLNDAAIELNIEIDLNDDEDQNTARKSIATKLDRRFKERGASFFLPMELNLSGKKLIITRNDYEEYILDLVANNDESDQIDEILEVLSRLNNISIKMEENLLVQRVDTLIKPDFSCPAEDFSAIKQNILNIVDNNERFHPVRLRQWATDKLKMIKNFNADD
jgi:MoxR-like ATPase